MVRLIRLLGALSSAALVINGGYWEVHHHIWAGIGMALLGIVSLVAVTGASAGHAEFETPHLE